MFVLTFLFFLFSLHSEEISPATYAICYDIDMSPFAGGEDLLFGNRLIEHGLNYLDKKGGVLDARNIVGRLYRLSELCAIYFPLNYFSSIVQHEVFGHGYRIRDINGGAMRVTGYGFDFPPPYGDGEAYTSFVLDPSQANTTQLTAVSMAGIEAQSILALLTKFKWIESDRIDPRQTILYLVSQLGLNLYATDEDLEEDLLDGHDIAEYVQTLNLTYTEAKETTSRLRALAWINFTDPFIYYSTYAWFRYIWTGKETKIPFIPIKEYGYLFGSRIGLTPFGPEFFLDNYLVSKNRPIYFYAKWGEHAKNHYMGLGFLASRLWSRNNWSLGTRVDLWMQPKLLLEQGRDPLAEIDFRDPIDKENPLYSSKEQQKKTVGCAGSLIGSFRVGRWMHFQIELGGKTEGFLPGYSLKASPVARISYLAHF